MKKRIATLALKKRKQAEECARYFLKLSGKVRRIKKIITHGLVAGNRNESVFTFRRANAIFISRLTIGCAGTTNTIFSARRERFVFVGGVHAKHN
jgi:hypothetical protein